AFVALHDAIQTLLDQALIEKTPIHAFVAAVSVGLLGSNAVLDLDYIEDSTCDTDMNVVMTEAGAFIEVQGTAEGQPFDQEALNQMLSLAKSGTQTLIQAQKKALGLL
ncbi:MAG: ribonuclease PH, partial [Neisseriaceae bacterium]|nr:ribonuclease PH [Neisseriaceae bacterium]